MFSAFRLTKFAFPLLLASGTIALQKKRSFYAFTFPNTPEVIRGEYENKIRSNSPPEKIFEVFANEKDEEGGIFMSHEDFFKSICPFSYSTKESDDDGDDDDKKDDEKKESEEKKEIKTFQSKALQQFADVDKDGKISIYEYYLVIQFLQIKNKDIQSYFEKNALKELNKEQLNEFFTFIRKGAKAKLTMSNVLESRKFSVNKEMFQKHILMCIENLLEQKATIPTSKILSLKENIIKDIFQYQFESFPVNEEGKISGEDFAKSLISYMEPKKCKQYLKQLNSVKFTGEFSFDEFYNFSRFLKDNEEKIQDTIQRKGYTNRKQFKRLIEEYQKTAHLNVNLQQIDILIKVLDANQNNRIEADEFKALVLHVPTYGSGEDTSLQKPYEKLVQLGQSWVNKAERIWEIIVE